MASFSELSRALQEARCSTKQGVGGNEHANNNKHHRNNNQGSHEIQLVDLVPRWRLQTEQVFARCYCYRDTYLGLLWDKEAMTVSPFWERKSWLYLPYTLNETHRFLVWKWKKKHISLHMRKPGICRRDPSQVPQLEQTLISWCDYVIVEIKQGLQLSKGWICKWNCCFLTVPIDDKLVV